MSVIGVLLQRFRDFEANLFFLFPYQTTKSSTFFCWNRFRMVLKEFQIKNLEKIIFFPTSKFWRWKHRNFWVILEDPKPEKFEKIYFTGNDPGWSETYYKPKISEKLYGSNFLTCFWSRSFYYIRRISHRVPPRTSLGQSLPLG